MMKFNKAFERLIEYEGDYSEHPDDDGGKTKYGITERTARQWGYMGSMRELPLNTAKHIYKKGYWNKLKCDDLPAVLQYAVFDAGVNSGPRLAASWLQWICNHASRIKIDGLIGPITISTLKYAIKNEMSAERILSRYTAIRMHHLTSRNDWRVFGKGWTNRVMDILDNPILMD